MRKIFGICLFGLALSGLTLGPAVVYAQDDAASVARQVEALSVEAADHFRAEQYEEAIALFEEAYDLEPVPNLLFNIGRCYEQLEEWELAKEHFEQFITSPDVATEAREKAMERVQSLNEIIAAEAEEEEDQEEEIAELDETEPDDEPDMLPGYAAVGTGGLLIIGGVVMGVLANGNANRIGEPGLSYDERLDAQSTARTQGIVADVFYVTGAAATAAGIYLLLTAKQETDSVADSARAIAPWFDRNGAGIGIHLDF